MRQYFRERKNANFFLFYSKTKPKTHNLFKTNWKSLSLFFSDPPSFIDLKNQTKEIVEGVKMSLQCNVTVANPEPNITWYSATGNDTVLSNAVHLTFSNISRSNSGNYFCVAENGIGPKLTSGMITLNVQCKFIDFLLKCICNDKKKTILLLLKKLGKITLFSPTNVACKEEIPIYETKKKKFLHGG